MRGDNLASALTDSSLCVINSDSPTRLPSNGSASSPDVTLISAHLALDSSWSTNVSLNSDHLPITINIDDTPPPDPAKRTFVNFRLAKWDEFVVETEAAFRVCTPPTSCAAGEKTFRNILLSASKHCIPAGRHQNFVPGLPREAVDLTKLRDDLHRHDPSDPEISRLNDNITSIVCESAKKEWIETVESGDLKSDPAAHWSLIKKLSGKKSYQPPNQPISFGSRAFTKPAAIARRFNKQYTSVKVHRSNKKTRIVQRRLHKLHKIDHSFAPFSMQDTDAAIRQSSNSSAAGPDGLTALHLKHLGQSGTKFLTHLFNLSVSNADLPANVPISSPSSNLISPPP